jgi:hypothetical protein
LVRLSAFVTWWQNPAVVIIVRSIQSSTITCASVSFQARKDLLKKCKACLNLRHEYPRDRFAAHRPYVGIEEAGFLLCEAHHECNGCRFAAPS